MNRVLVIGATGNIGREVVSQLVGAGPEILALTRNPGVAAFPSQVEVRYGDLTAPDSLDDALRGVDAVFLVWTAPADAVAPALDRIVKHARRIVYLSAPIRTAHPLFQQPNPLRGTVEHIERLLVSSGREWTFLRPTMYASNAVGWWAPQIHDGDVVRWPYAKLPTAPIHEKDVAAVAVRALCETGRAGKDYVLTGPDSLTHAEQVSIIGRAIGRPLRLEEISPDDWRRERLGLWPETFLEMLLNAWAAAAGHPAFVTSTVAEITGNPARSFSEWALDHASQFQGRRDTNS